MAIESTNEVRVPVFLTGIVVPPGPSICMQAGGHVLITMAGSVDIVGTNDEARRLLDSYSGTRQRVTVGGYPQSGVECQFLGVYVVSTPEELVNRLGIAALQ